MESAIKPIGGLAQAIEDMDFHDFIRLMVWLSNLTPDETKLKVWQGNQVTND